MWWFVKRRFPWLFGYNTIEDINTKIDKTTQTPTNEMAMTDVVALLFPTYNEHAITKISKNKSKIKRRIADLLENEQKYESLWKKYEDINEMYGQLQNQLTAEKKLANYAVSIV